MFADLLGEHPFVSPVFPFCQSIALEIGLDTIKGRIFLEEKLVRPLSSLAWADPDFGELGRVNELAGANKHPACTKHLLFAGGCEFEFSNACKTTVLGPFCLALEISSDRGKDPDLLARAAYHDGLDKRVEFPNLCWTF